MARVMFNSFVIISLSDKKLTMFQEAFKTPLTVNTRPLLRVEYPRNHQLKRAIYPIRYSGLELNF